MTAVMWTYSQVVWAYFILDAATLATTKFVEMPTKNSTHSVNKENPRLKIEDFSAKTNSSSKDITAKADSLQPLGLFVAQPSNIQELLQHNAKDQLYQPRYAENFGMAASSSEQRYRGIEPKLALFTKSEKKGKKSRLPEPKGSDRYLTPELYKFKTDIEKETVRTHIRGLKMSPDASAAPTIIHDSRYQKYRAPRYNYRGPSRPNRPNNPVREETFINPYVYDEPYSYEESPSTPYAKPVSYQQYSSIPRDPHYPSSTGNSYYEPPSDYSFPYYPTAEPEPYYYPKPAEPDSYNKYSDPSYNDFPVEYPPSPPLPSLDFHDTQSYFPGAKNRETAGENEEPEDGSPANDEDDVDDKDFPASDPTPKTPKKSHRNPNYEVSEYGTDPGETDVTFSRDSPKKKRPHAKPRRPQAPPKEDEDEEFDSNYEPPDGFQEDKDENVDAEDSNEDEPLPPKQARLRLPSKKLVKRVRGRPSRSRNKRCVKKRKEMSVETELASGGFDEEPSKKMTCLVCENLDTGGTYETCTYESDPKKNSYHEGSEASYRKGNKNPYKYRMRRQTVTVINSTTSPSKHIVRRSYNSDSMGSFTSDVEDFASDDFNDDDHEDQQEDDDDDFEEYKPSRPAYASKDACTEVSKNGLTCMVCHNPETNGKYKQCSYANDPDKNNFEYAQSSSYGTKAKEVPYKKRQRRQPNKKADQKAEGMQSQDTNSKEIKVPRDWKLLRSIEQKKIGAINDNFQKLLHSKEPDATALASIGNPSYEEQFLSLFPELNSADESGESLLGEHSLLKELNEKPTFAGKSGMSSGFGKEKIGGYFKGKNKKSILDDDDIGDTEMSRMMKEFKSKDRSACKKSMKDKMTCYVCDDKDGIKREECMYIVENEPTKVSYHESKNTSPEESEAKSSTKREVYYKSPLKVFKYKYIPALELKDQPGVGSTIHKTISNKPIYKYGSSHKPSKGYSDVKIHTQKTYSLKTLPTKIGKSDLIGAHTEQLTVGSTKVHRKRKPELRPEEEEGTADPEETGEHSAAEIIPEVDPESPDGLFSDETEDVYSPEYKVTLPRYMVEKNEHEQIVDDFLNSME